MNESTTNSCTECQLNFDFNFDDLDSSVDHSELTKPYQFHQNIQFVNIDINDINPILLERKASNSLSNHFHSKIRKPSKPNPNNHNHFLKLRHKPSLFSEKEYDTDDGDHQLSEVRHESPMPYRTISTFTPVLYDICSLMSFPLNISGNSPIPIASLEYIRTCLPDFTEFNRCIHDTLSEYNYQLRTANYIGTMHNMDSVLVRNGGCKILHFMAYVCNPMRGRKGECPLMATFPSDAYYKCDTNYVLIETEKLNGKWIKASDLKRMIAFDIHLNDIIICVSPQSIQLCDIFANVFGYKHVIGVECSTNSYQSFSATEPAIFLKYFYSSILNQECIDRAFKLAKTTTLLQRTGARNINTESDTKYVLITSNDGRYVAFPHLIKGRVQNVLDYKSDYNCIKTNLRCVIRPFIGRSESVLQLINCINVSKVSYVVGEENNGRASVVQNTVRYLLQHFYFDSCLIIDCDKMDRNHAFMDRLYTLLCDEMDIEMEFDNTEMDLNVFQTLDLDNIRICFIILNANKWHKIHQIYTFLDVFNTESNNECRCIVSTDETSKMIENSASLYINPLNKEYISELFQSLVISNCYRLTDIINHTQLHRICNGSPRVTKRVCEFVNSVHSQHNHQLTLDEIAIKYPKSPFAKYKSELTVSIPEYESDINQDWNESINSDFIGNHMHRRLLSKPKLPHLFIANDNAKYNKHSMEVHRSCLTPQNEPNIMNLTPNNTERQSNVNDLELMFSDEEDTVVYTNNDRNAFGTPSFCDVQNYQSDIDFENLHIEFNYSNVKNTAKLTLKNDDSFPDIGMIGDLEKFKSFETKAVNIIISDCGSQSMDFNGFYTQSKLYKTKTKTVSPKTDFEYGYCECGHIEDDCDKLPPLNTLKLAPKDSDEPEIEMTLAEINDDISHNNNNRQFLKTQTVIHGYNSGSDDTLYSDSHSPNMHLRGTITHCDTGNVSEEEMVDAFLWRHKSFDICDTDSLSLKLRKKNSHTYTAESDKYDCYDIIEESVENNTENLNVIAHLGRISGDARAIWVQSETYNEYAYLGNLYPFLIRKFQFVTGTKNYYPSMSELEHYFVRFGGKRIRNHVCSIHITKYNKFYEWFIFMCKVVSDLRMIYENYNLNCLFYGKQMCENILNKQSICGVFMILFTNKMNCLCLKYNKRNEICNLLLTRHKKDLYSIHGTHGKQVSLHRIIRPRTYLKYLYTPNTLIPKKSVF